MAKSKSKAKKCNGYSDLVDLDNVKNSELAIKLTKSSSKSLAWSYFGILNFIEGERLVESKRNKWICYVCFTEAKGDRFYVESDIKEFSVNISTTSLLAHISKDHKISIHSRIIQETNKTIQQYFDADRTVASSSSSKSNLKFILIRDLVLLCCRDLLSFDLVDGKGLRDFLEKYKVAAIDLPHRTSISRALTTVYDDCRAWLVDHIRINCPSTVAATFDGWSDKYRRRSYVTPTLHGSVINQRRTQITPDNLDKVVFMHNNYDYVKDHVANIVMKD